MKALIKKKAMTGLWMEEVPIPAIKENEVLIKTYKTSICGTDVHIYKWDSWAQKTVPTPLIIGHEFMGEIAQVGSGIKNLKIGDRVTAEGHLTCGNCFGCRTGKKHLCSHSKGLGVNYSGCFAEYFKMPAENIFLLPSTISDELAAIFDPFGNAVHASMSSNLSTEDVLITGAGPIGVMATAIAKHSGAHIVVVTDTNDFRLHLAKEMGATHTVNINKESLEDQMTKAGIKGFTVGLEMSGSPEALRSMIKEVHSGAKIALLGILPPETSIDWQLVIFKMLEIKGIYGREIFGTWYKILQLIDSGLNLNPLITHHFNIDDYEKGFRLMLKGQCGKIILNWINDAH